MKRVTHIITRPSTDVDFYFWNKDGVVRIYQKYWDTGKINHRIYDYSDDALTATNTQIWTNEGWDEFSTETDPAIIAEKTANMLWNTEHNIVAYTTVQDI